MAEPLPDPVLVRQPVVERSTLLLTQPWVHWLDAVRALTLTHETRLAALEARIAALEGAP